MIPNKEDQHTEFKTSFSDEVLVSLTAFANAKGGEVYIGVNDKGVAVGVDIGPETLAKWINEIKLKTEPSIIPDAEISEIDGRHIVILHVPEYPVKPVSTRGRYYKRQHNSNHLLSANEIADMILQSRNTSWDSYPRIGLTFQMLSEDKIRTFIGKVNSAGRFRLPESPEEALAKLGMLQNSVPTNAAYLLFAKEDTHYNVHIGRFKTPSTIIDDKMLSGTLFEVVDEAMQTIVGHLKFAFDINIKGGKTNRTEIPEYPLTAIRELLLNAIVHRDYQSPTDVQIKIFDQRIEFFNPSGLFGNITEESLATDTYKASTRNKQIAEAFYLTKDIEKYGSGYIRIRKELLAYPSMRFFYKNEGYGFSAGLEYGDGTLNGTLNPSQSGVLEFIGKNAGCNATAIISGMGISRNTINKILRTLIERHLIERRGSKKAGGYWPVLKQG
ncbi:MAG: putative DNA binding domain-containing protein [Bacteroidales bacterium]|nr:putative DNA binding domain-containing protein [Bacteroidales bacterium]